MRVARPMGKSVSSRKTVTSLLRKLVRLASDHHVKGQLKDKEGNMIS